MMGPFAPYCDGLTLNAEAWDQHGCLAEVQLSGEVHRCRTPYV